MKLNKSELQKHFGWSDRDFDIAMVNGMPVTYVKGTVKFDVDAVSDWLLDVKIDESKIIRLVIRRLKINLAASQNTKDIISISSLVKQLEEELIKEGVIK